MYKKILTKTKAHGQAVVEYLIFLAVMTIIAVNLINAIHGFFASNIGRLAVVLSRQLKSGVCERSCFYNNYENAITDE